MGQELLSLICHELRTPITAITGYLDLVLEDEGLGPEREREYLLRAQANVAHLAEIVGAFQDLVYLEQGRTPVTALRLNLDRLLHQVADGFSSRSESEDLHLRVEVARADIEFASDHGLLSRALASLIENACRYTPKGGAITLRGRIEGSRLVIEIEDTGVGIPLEEQGRVFSPFFRGSNVRSIKPKGTGLRLTITKALIELLGGRITFTSTPGRGTCFRFSLPLGIRGRPAGTAVTAAG